MKRLILYIMVLLVAVSCYKDAEYDQTLGILMEYNVFPASGGSTQVAIFSDTTWTAQMDRQVSWASIDRMAGYKSGHLVFDYEVNYGRSRRLYLILKAGDETRTMCMFQKAGISDKDCYLDLGTEEVSGYTVGPEENTVEIPFRTNLVYDLEDMYLTLTYPEGQEPDSPWITLKSVERSKIKVQVAPNGSNQDRTTYIQVSHMDAGVVKMSDGKVYDSAKDDSYEGRAGDELSSNIITIVQTK